MTQKQLDNLKLGRVKGIKRPGVGFKKGHIPWNKELKGIHLSPSSELKKGQFIPHVNPNCKCFRCTGVIVNRVIKYGKDHPSWKGGEYINDSGYVLKLHRNHPSNVRKPYLREHRLILEAHLGRILTKDEIVHHINGNKTDNRLENLMIVTRSEHIKMHRDQLYRARWNK